MAASPATSWTLFRGDSQATGVASSKLPAQLDLIWEFQVDKGAFEGTAINDGIVYLGDLDGVLYAINLANGKEKMAA